MTAEPLTIDISATKEAIREKYTNMKTFLYAHETTRDREGMIRRIMAGQYGHSDRPESKYQELLRFMQEKHVLIQRNH